MSNGDYYNVEKGATLDVDQILDGYYAQYYLVSRFGDKHKAH